MEIKELESLWASAIDVTLSGSIQKRKLHILAKQTYDSIRRIGIYENYKERAILASEQGLPFKHTSNPFILSQRTDLNLRDKAWIIYLATYFGKSDKSKWTLFNRAAFDLDELLIDFNQVSTDVDRYFKHLSSFDFFEGCDYSNHRKFTAKNLIKDNGVFQSMEYVVKNIDDFAEATAIKFHDMYLMAKRIPNFGRLAAFDFSSSMVKCGFDVKEPISMYAEHSTGPLKALGLLLRLTGNQDSTRSRNQLSSDLVEWFSRNSKVFMVGQVLEDLICNWQKNTMDYIRYMG